VIYLKKEEQVFAALWNLFQDPQEKKRLSIIEGNLAEQHLYDSTPSSSSENIYRGSLPNGDIPSHLSNGFYSQISQIRVDKKISPEANYQPNVYSRNISLVSGDPADSSSYYQSEEQNSYFVDNIMHDVYKQQQPNSSSYYRIEPQQKVKSNTENTVYDSGYFSDDFNSNPFNNKKNYLSTYHQDFVPNYSLPSLNTVMETHMNNIASEDSNKVIKKRRPGRPKEKRKGFKWTNVTNSVTTRYSKEPIEYNTQIFDSQEITEHAEQEKMVNDWKCRKYVIK